MKNYQNKDCKFVDASDWVIDGTKSPFQYGPAWEVQYDASPWNADVKKEDLAGYNVIQATVKTRAAVSALGKVTSPAFAYPGENGGRKLFNMDNGTGVLTAGLQIEKPWNLNENSTAATTDKKYANDANTEIGRASCRERV